ncbi:hypothetical protein EYF80_001759 [Liparis tanakae]|uniref:Uncharacterized protein n=1 Tax=Liparis tanakae TaxID=230148 RepID=A0A4Z2JBU5_9TELE|nr:hypothetical protein EYF80_001759 [Liparis tanakae]
MISDFCFGEGRARAAHLSRATLRRPAPPCYRLLGIGTLPGLTHFSKQDMASEDHQHCLHTDDMHRLMQEAVCCREAGSEGAKGRGSAQLDGDNP